MKFRCALPVLSLLAGVVGADVVRIGSARTVDPLAAAWVREFNLVSPADRAEVISTSAYPTGAIAALIAGEVDVAVVARELFASEQEAARRGAGGELRLYPVATGARSERGGTHAIAIHVNERNPLARLSLPQLAEILAGDGRVRTWADVGVTGPLGAREIRVHGMVIRRETGDPPGIVNYMEKAVLAGRAWRRDVVEHPDRPGGPTALEAIVQAVAADEAAIGYSGFDYARPGTKTLSLARSDAGPYFEGTGPEVAAREYPLCRTIYLCFRANVSAAASRWVQYALSRAGQGVLEGAGTGFAALPELQPSAGAGYLAADGAVRVVGYNDMREMLQELTRRFSTRHPAFRFELSLPGTKAAPEALARGASAFAPMGADFSEVQLANYRQLTGGDPLVFRIAHASLSPAALSGPIAVFVHRDNPLREISLPQLAALFSGRLLDPELDPCGLAAETALGREFIQRVLPGASFGPRFVGMAQSADVVRHVAAHPRSIGFAAGVKLDDKVRALALAQAEGAAAVELSPGNLRSGRYPLGRHLLLAVRRPVEPWVRHWLEFVLSDEGQDIIAQGTLGYLPLNQTDAERERARIE